MLVALGLVDALGKPTAKQRLLSDNKLDTAPQRPTNPNAGTSSHERRTTTYPTDSTEVVNGFDGGYTRVGNVSLPSDLLWLCGRGLSPFAVLGLMKQARAASQRLSDVAHGAHKYLFKLKANQLYAYIKALLVSGRDFSAGMREEQTKEQENREHEYLAQKSEIYEGKSFISKKSGKVFRIESGAVRETDGQRSCMAPFTIGFIEAVEAGKLVPVDG